MNYEKYLQLVAETARYNTKEIKSIENSLFKEDLGIDSILLISLIVKIEKELSKDFTFEKLKNLSVKTPKDLWKYLELPF